MTPLVVLFGFGDAAHLQLLDERNAQIEIRIIPANETQTGHDADRNERLGVEA